MPHHFDDSSQIEAKWAPTLDGWVRESGYHFRLATSEEQWRGIDRIIGNDAGGTTSVDYKCDERVALKHPTGNLFIETVSNATSGRAGWAVTSEADWLFYFAVPSTVLVFTFAHLRLALVRWRRHYPERAAQNERYATLGLCVPLKLGMNAAEYTAHLDHGDCLVMQERRG